MKKTWMALAAAGALLPGAALAATAAEMQALADKSGCFSCHGMQSKLVGPGFAEVAARYKGDSQAAASLAKKIREGGKGAWGRIPMPPHGNLGEDDAKKLAEWVLGVG
ncbi:putative cytochrome C precurseur; similar to cytochrome c-551 from Pseudomonas aeruginosa [Cupriavidus taiwanensis]|uniref:Cytochrome C precurseur similar to cytochrome c-551 from Pseudomonas aeruginosa n=1 Tax=Cupriavidus taiwanensis TaxID=164546 RepID=A0A975X952_9BURK|nr:c-type cytochrome [Cupriavidus taiwanensis]SOY62706.1 putative cytochrome C precurseur; similar to cytochrome c-551 from Pseudomonas aeruginosa [Cupriavidus taiwanensis]